MSGPRLPAARAGRLDRDYLPGLGVPSVQPYLDRYAERSAAARNALTWRELSYGADPAERVHFFPAPTSDAPLVVFVHGGYWQLLDEWSSAYGAPGLVAAGAAFAAVGYPLSPHAAVGRITAAVRTAVRALVADAAELGVDPRRVVLVGHSVGAQLAGMCLVPPEPVPAAGAVLLSGLYELEPLQDTSVGAEVGLSEAEVAGCGPLRHLHAGLPPLVLVRGADEPAGFDVQQRLAADRATALGVPVTELVVPGRNHFDLPLGLGDPHDPVGSAVHALTFGDPDRPVASAAHPPAPGDSGESAVHPPALGDPGESAVHPPALGDPGESAVHPPAPGDPGESAVHPPALGDPDRPNHPVASAAHPPAPGDPGNRA